MKRRVYVSYGSNMSRDQMEFRCQDARVLAKGYLLNYELNFCGNLNGNNYATVIAKEGAKTPVLLWTTSELDERLLDRYEGYPRFYRKEIVKADELVITERFGRFKFDEAYVYIMNSIRLGTPSIEYFTGILDAYEEFDFDLSFLFDAYKRCQ